MSEPMTLTCKLEPPHEAWQPVPFPGSDDARAKGCTCPFEQPWPGALTFAFDCPVHELVPASTSESLR